MASASSSSVAGRPLEQVLAATDLSDSPLPSAADDDPSPTAAAKKRKKKKKKPKSAAAALAEDDDDAVLARAVAANGLKNGASGAGGKVPLPPPSAQRANSSLCISRNKHWRHISAYHGPWLQLPVELLESLLALNLDPLSLAPLPSSLRSSSPLALGSPTSDTASSSSALTAGSLSAQYGGASANGSSSIPLSKLLGTGKERASAPTPPPIDPGVFRSIINIRRLVDEASDLAIRASSGLTAFNLSALSAQSLNAIEPPKGENGRPASMNATRTHRLRVLACQRLAEAYKWDEVACSVMVMQGATALDDLADKVLKIDPENIDALYVNFFHEKIPSRMVAENTTTAVLDHLIARAPGRLEFFRTRGIVKMFLDQFSAAARDFTHALRESRVERKRRTPGKGAKKKGKGKARAKGSGGSGGGGGGTSSSSSALVHHSSSATVEDDSSLDLVPHCSSSPFSAPLDDRPQHPSARPEAPLPMEPQCLFLRASSYFTHAVWLIEGAALEIEGVKRNGTNDGVEVRLCNIPGGRFGGVENGHTEGPLGAKKGEKYRTYRAEYEQDKWKADVHALARKAIRDHERFVAHFDQMESTCIHADSSAAGDSSKLLTNGMHPSPSTHEASHGSADAHKHGHSHTQTFTTYHPLLVESHYCILLCYLLLGDIKSASEAYLKTTHLIDGVEGYPVFLPARSMAQAEFLEIFERLATWRYAFGPRTNAAARGIADLRASTSSPPQPEHVPSTPSDTVEPAIPAPFDDPVKHLDAARTMVIRALAKAKERRQRQAEKVAEAKRRGKNTSFSAINIPLSGPRVEIMLVWMAAVILPDLEAANNLP